MAGADDKAASFAVVASKLAGMMALRFGWSPTQFWDATPAELHSIFVALAAQGQGDGSVLPPEADTLAQLMEAFPDG